MMTFEVVGGRGGRGGACMSLRLFPGAKNPGFATGTSGPPKKPIPLILKDSLLEKAKEETDREPADPDLPGKRPL